MAIADQRESPTGSRLEQSEQTRARLLAVSLELFVRKGYAATTVRDVAAASGVSTGLMFHYFASKQMLLETHATMIGAGIDQVVAMLTSATDPLETFREIAARLLSSLDNPGNRARFLLANQIMSLDSIPGESRRLVSATRSLDASVPLIRLGQESGVIRAGNPMGLAVGFWGALQGIAEVLVWNDEAAVPDVEQLVAMLKA